MNKINWRIIRNVATEKTLKILNDFLSKISDRISYIENNYLLKSGGTMSGGIDMDENDIENIGDITLGTDGEYYERWVNEYSVDFNGKELLDKDGNSLDAGGVYRFRCHIATTGTDQGLCAVVWNRGGIWYVNNTSQSGLSSNHMEIIIDTVPKIKTWHGSFYTISIFSERFILKETSTDNTAHLMGADGFMRNYAGTLLFKGSALATTREVHHEGNTVLSKDGLASADIDMGNNDIINTGNILEEFEVLNGTDLDTLTKSGSYRINNTPVNAPSGNSWAYSNMLVLRNRTSNTYAQVIFDYNSPRAAFRSYNAVSWEDWNEFCHENNAPINKRVSNASIIPQPEGGIYYNASSNTTGWIRILLPQRKNSTMIRMTIKVFDYGASQSFDLVVSGYCISTGDGWTNTTVYAVGGSSHSVIRVVFGDDGANSGIWIGNVLAGSASVWGHPIIQVMDVMTAYTGSALDNWKDRWDVTITQTDPVNPADIYADARTYQ